MLIFLHLFLFGTGIVPFTSNIIPLGRHNAAISNCLKQLCATQ